MEQESQPLGSLLVSTSQLQAGARQAHCSPQAAICLTCPQSSASVHLAKMNRTLGAGRASAEPQWDCGLRGPKNPVSASQDAAWGRQLWQAAGPSDTQVQNRPAPLEDSKHFYAGDAQVFLFCVFFSPYPQHENRQARD